MFNLSLNVDPVIICPYNSNHKIARSRIQKHLVKCEKNYPPNYKQQCPYDATHRFFEHELKEHVESCPMQFSYLDQVVTKLPATILDSESNIDDSEIWEKGKNLETFNNPFNEPTPETIEPKQYTTLTSIRGNITMAKKFGNSLRRPYGYSESMMLDVSSQESAEDDTESVTSTMGIGRGQHVQLTHNQNVRGTSRIYKRGFRGRSYS